jgi:hypothetical protein
MVARRDHIGVEATDTARAAPFIKDSGTIHLAAISW